MVANTEEEGADFWIGDHKSLFKLASTRMNGRPRRGCFGYSSGINPISSRAWVGTCLSKFFL